MKHDHIYIPWVPSRWLVLGITAFWALLAYEVAHSATGLAIVTRDATVAGKLVKDVQPQPVQVYATPKAGDYVRVAPTKDEIWTIGVWKAWPIPAGDKYETCTTDTPEESWTAATCSTWNVRQFAVANTTGVIPLSWTLPIQNVDGSPLTDLAGIRIYSAANGSPLTQLQQVGPTVTAQALTGYKDGLYDFEVTAITSAGAESARSARATVSVKIPTTPAAPALTVSSQTVYTLVKSKNKFTLLPVGSVPAGTPCDASQRYNDYYVVDTAKVSWNGTVKPYVVVAACH